MRNKTSVYVLWLLCLILAVVVMVGVLNRKWIYDYYRSVTYSPTSEMTEIRDGLKLTGQGTFIFNASQPRLSESAEFNNVCRTGRDTEIAVLGCYTGEDILVYNITNEELDGIRELTTAHELLHATYARLSNDEKTSLNKALEQVRSENQELFSEELGNYTSSEQQEELYVRAGTEIAKLPTILEDHFANYFKDQDLIVSYYDQYITVFRELESDMDNLRTEMDNISSEVEEKTDIYEQKVFQLNLDIDGFNACAATAGCFESEYAFNTRRAELIYEQDNLDTLYEEINSLISEYNIRVELYNADVTHSEKLNQIINSEKQVEKIK